MDAGWIPGAARFTPQKRGVKRTPQRRLAASFYSFFFLFKNIYKEWEGGGIIKYRFKRYAIVTLLMSDGIIPFRSPEYIEGGRIIKSPGGYPVFKRRPGIIPHPAAAGFNMCFESTY